MSEQKIVAQFGLGVKVLEDGNVQVWSIAIPIVTAPAEEESWDQTTWDAPKKRAKKGQKKFFLEKPEPKIDRPGQRVMIDGTEYLSVSQAARAKCLTRWQVKDRCASDQYPTWSIPQ